MSKDSSSPKNASEGLVLEASLQGFFYDQLQEINKKASNPLPREAVFYSSTVLDKFGLSHKLFDIESGKYRDKILGKKLLECGQLSGKIKERALKDVGDTALFVCGYFSESVNKKLVDLRYYQEIGVIAYHKLNHHTCDEVYDTPAFFKNLSKLFPNVTSLINILAQKYSVVQGDLEAAYVILGNDSKIKAS